MLNPASQKPCSKATAYHHTGYGKVPIKRLRYSTLYSLYRQQLQYDKARRTPLDHRELEHIGVRTVIRYQSSSSLTRWNNCKRAEQPSSPAQTGSAGGALSSSAASSSATAAGPEKDHSVQMCRRETRNIQSINNQPNLFA